MMGQTVASAKAQTNNTASPARERANPSHRSKAARDCSRKTTFSGSGWRLTDIRSCIPGGSGEVGEGLAAPLKEWW